jgi:hypothetical protein
MLLPLSIFANGHANGHAADGGQAGGAPLAAFGDRPLSARRADPDAGAFGVGGQRADPVDGHVVADRAPGFGVNGERRADGHLEEAASETGENEAFGLPEAPAAGSVIVACVDKATETGGQAAAVYRISGEPAVAGDRVNAATIALRAGEGRAVLVDRGLYGFAAFLAVKETRRQRDGRGFDLHQRSVMCRNVFGHELFLPPLAAAMVQIDRCQVQGKTEK